jgi:hypothetical protein
LEFDGNRSEWYALNLCFGGVAPRLRTMSLITEQVDERELEKRIQRQKALVARFVSEGKSTIEANAELYELSNALCSMRERRRPSSSSA